MTGEMKVKALAPWFGGKRTLAPEIVKQLGPHTQYFEPFCGSMAVLFAKEPSRQETVNDLHYDVTNLAFVLQHNVMSQDLYARLQRTIVCEGLLRQAQEYFETCEWGPDTVLGMDERAYWYFLSSWMARNGVAGMDRQDFQLAVRWTAGGGSPTVRFRSAVESIPRFHRRLQNVVIINRDAFAIIPKFQDSPHTAIYVDPPYPAETRSHGKYLHEFENSGDLFGKDDHATLADLLGNFKEARVVVSSYDCQRIRELYDGWTFVDKSRNKNLHSQNGRGARTKEAPEVLIVNGAAL